MLDPDGVPVKRNFVHVDDLVRGDPGGDRQPARAPADLQHLHGRTGRLRRAGRLPGEDAQAAERADPTPYHSTWLDNTKAKFLLGWRPRYDLARMTDAAFDYKRAPDDPRIVWYPG